MLEEKTRFDFLLLW